MDTDPLADAGPPRHAIESDDEDEFNPLSPKPRASKHTLDFRVFNTGKVVADKLIFASLEAGRIWAKGADLGPQLGSIDINSKPIGMIFNPRWTDGIVVVSETVNRLPMWAQYPYAQYVTDQFKPSKLLLLDSYPAPSYIQPKYVPLQKAPIRYLTLGRNEPIPEDFKPFSPPNLVQSVSAAFFSLVSLSCQISLQPSTGVTILLFPGPYRPLNSPDELTSATLSLNENDDLWPGGLTGSVHDVLSEGKHQWNFKGEGDTPCSQGKRRPYVEGSMYI